MASPTLRVLAILQKYMRDPNSALGDGASLREHGIDRLDLPMISLDVEDAFDVQLDCDDELESFAKLHELAAFLGARVAELASRPRPRTTVPRSKGSWMSTGAERRR